MDYHIAVHSVFNVMVKHRTELELTREPRVTSKGNVTQQVATVEVDYCRVKYVGHPLTRHTCEWHDCYVIWSLRSD